MKRDAVSSSNIKSIGYDKKMKLLEIEFNSGSVYQYSGVSESVYKDLINADSVGRYFNNIKNDYPYCKRG